MASVRRAQPTRHVRRSTQSGSDPHHAASAQQAELTHVSHEAPVPGTKSPQTTGVGHEVVQDVDMQMSVAWKASTRASP